MVCAPGRISRVVLTGIAVCAVGASLHADVILSATGLNDTLKKMQRLRQTIVNTATAGPARAEAWFQDRKSVV